MNKEEFLEILRDEALGGSKINTVGCNAVAGLNLIQKYLPNKGIEGTGYEVIYSVSADELFNAGITKEDAEELRALNWMIKDNIMACFV